MGRLEAVPPPQTYAPQEGPRVFSPRPGESLPRCPAPKVVASLDVYEGGGVAAGTGFLRIALTNLSGETCRLSGIPTVAAVDTAGRPIGAPAAKSPSLVGLARDGRHVDAARSSRGSSSHSQVLPMPNRRCPHGMRGGGQLTVGRIE
jgi:hypothetical protein